MGRITSVHSTPDQIVKATEGGGVATQSKQRCAHSSGVIFAASHAGAARPSYLQSGVLHCPAAA